MKQLKIATDRAPASRPPIASLNGLRFVAAMSVVAYHFYGMGISGSSGEPSEVRGPIAHFLSEYLPCLGNAHLAVDFFFILSGFVLAYVYADDMARHRFSYRLFMKKRIARIYPLYLAMLLLCIGMLLGAWSLKLTLNNPDAWSTSAIVPNLLLIQAFGVLDHLSINGPAWAVSAEWLAYLVFPLVMAAVMRNRLGRVGTLLATVAVFLCLYYLIPTDRPLTHRTYDFGILRMAAEFPIGVALFYVFDKYRQSGASAVNSWHVLALIIAVIAAMQFQVAESVVVLLLAALIFACAAAEATKGLPWLTRPWLVYGGTISYAIYLIHVPFIIVVRKIVYGLGVSPASFAIDALTVGCIVLVVPLAIIAYEWFEAPAQRWTLQLLTRPAKSSLVPSGSTLPP
jgi:peptidoglycan/LPS O-acetylase OafA/YrhL